MTGIILRHGNIEQNDTPLEAVLVAGGVSGDGLIPQDHLSLQSKQASLAMFPPFLAALTISQGLA